MAPKDVQEMFCRVRTIIPEFPSYSFCICVHYLMLGLTQHGGQAGCCHMVMQPEGTFAVGSGTCNTTSLHCDAQLFSESVRRWILAISY